MAAVADGRGDSAREVARVARRVELERLVVVIPHAHREGVDTSPDPPRPGFLPSRFFASCSGVGIRSDLGPRICLLASAILCSMSLTRALRAAS